MVTSSAIADVIDALAAHVGRENGNVNGHPLRAVCLTIFDDGSGMIGRRTDRDQVQDYHDFSNAGELVALLRGEGVEILHVAGVIGIE